MKIAILQPLVPHYREVLFDEINKEIDTDIHVYKKQSHFEKHNMKQGALNVQKLSSFNFLGAMVYNFFPLISPKYKILVLPGEIRSLSTWLLLLLGKLTSKKIILWGHGISVKNYLQEEKKLLPIRVFFHRLADHIWLYTEKEKEIWSNYIDPNKITALNNTIDTSVIFKQKTLSRELLKEKYQIATGLNLIYCARFTANRRIDLMVELIKKLKNKDIGLIVIGDGEYKPDFSEFEHVYDFGAIYDDAIKHELFTVVDVYFQPAWTGLSIVEAMAYGKPILTFKRSEDILQCVEYSYIEHMRNGYIANNLEDLIEFIETVTLDEINSLSSGAKKYAESFLSMEKMVSRAKNSLLELGKNS